MGEQETFPAPNSVPHKPGTIPKNGTNGSMPHNGSHEGGAGAGQL
jgi:hypothetical protein